MLYAHVEIEMPNVLIEGLSLERNVTKGLSSEKRNEVPFIREKHNEVPFIGEKRNGRPFIREKRNEVPFIREKRNEVPFIREKRNEGRSLKTLDLAFRVSAVHQHFIFRFIIMSFISQGRNQAEIEFL